MSATPSPAAAPDSQAEAVSLPENLRAMNEALLLGSLRQHELIETADATNALLREEITARQRTQLALDESESRYRALFDAVPVAVFVCDLDGVVQSYNHRAAELWGRRPKPGDPMVRYCGSAKLYLPDGALLPHDQSPMVEVMRTGVAVKNVEVFSERTDGSRIPVIVNFDALKNERGEVTGAIASFDDMSDIKQAEKLVQESELRFRAIADNIPQLAWMVSAEGHLEWFNRGWLDYTGTTLEDNVGSGWKAVHHPAHIDVVAEKFERHLRLGIDWEDTFPLRGKDGEYRWFLSRMVAIRDDQGKLLSFFGTNTDVTAQQAAEDALKDADRRKTEFLALLAHELRNPLAPISNAVQILLQNEQPGSEVTQTAVRMMERQVGQMVRLVDDLLDVSRISQNKIELRRAQLELASVLRHAVEAASPAYTRKGVELIISEPPQAIILNGDSTRLTQVVGNLLNNAVKFTPTGGKVRLTVAAEGSEAVIRVEDNGIGIAEDKLPQLFELFMQVDESLERTQGGLGIGLSLVKRLVEMHGGSVEVSSAGLGLGSTFVLRLPMLEAAAAEQAAAPVSSTEVAAVIQRRILVVDDNLASAQSLGLLLKLKGHVVEMAHDGREALAKATASRPEVILLDIGLPILNGYEVASRIRAEPWGAAITLIALTGWGQPDDIRRALDAGFDQHMVKPVRHSELMALLAGLPVGAGVSGNSA